jgi:hypothetical protein
MELLFLFISIILTFTVIYLIGRSMFTDEELIRAYCTSEFLILSHTMMALLLICTIFVTLCAANNTFWHLPYLTK